MGQGGFHLASALDGNQCSASPSDLEEHSKCALQLVLMLKKLFNQNSAAINSIRQILHSPSLIFAIMGLIGTGFIIFATSRFNAGVSPDSVEYISTARNIANGSGINYWNNSPLLIEPPLYPIVLALVNFVFKADLLSSARFVNAFLFGLIIYLSGFLFVKHLKSSLALVFLALVSVLVSPALIEISIMIWTEALFICLIMLYIIFSERYVEKRNIISLIILSFTTSLAALTRYIGIILIPIGIIYILFFNRDKLLTKIRHLFLFGSVSTLPIAIYVVRNYILSHSLFGYNPTAIGAVTFYQGAINTYNEGKWALIQVLSWYLPERIMNSHRLLLILIIVIGFIFAVGYKENLKSSI